MHLQLMGFSSFWGCVRSNLMCTLLYFHIGESYRMGRAGTFHLFQLLLKRNVLEVEVLGCMALGPLHISLNF